MVPRDRLCTILDSNITPLIPHRMFPCQKNDGEPIVAIDFQC